MLMQSEIQITQGLSNACGSISKGTQVKKIICFCALLSYSWTVDWNIEQKFIGYISTSQATHPPGQA